MSRSDTIGSALLCILSLVLSLLFGELALRMLGFRGEVSWTLTDVIPVDDPILDFRLRPHSRSFSGGVIYEMNGKGFRDIERPYEKPKSVRRVVVVGDSIAFGYKIKLEDTFPRVMERLMSISRNREIQVITLAMPGLNTIQESRLLQEADKYHPDMVVVAYSLNDAEVGISARGAERPCRIELIGLPFPCTLKNALKRSAFVYFVKDRIDHLVWRLGYADRDDVFASIKSDYFGNLYAREAAWKGNVVDGLDTIARFARSRKIPVAVVIFPILFELDTYRWGWIHEKVGAEAGSRGMVVVDLLGEYRKRSVIDLRVERGDFVHPGTEGHRVAADVVAAVVRERLARCEGERQNSTLARGPYRRVGGALMEGS